MLRQVIIVLGILLYSFVGFAQTDSLSKMPVDSGYLYPKWKVSEPMRAALLSAVVPGLGQIYNKEKWYLELPIIYGAGALLWFNVSQNHKNYIEFRNALLYTLDQNELTLIPEKFIGYDQARLTEVRDRYRRERDYYIILSAVAYLLNVAEAATMAHLKTFDVSDDLSLRLEPYIENMAMPQSPLVGVSLKFYIEPKKYAR